MGSSPSTRKSPKPDSTALENVELKKAPKDYVNSVPVEDECSKEEDISESLSPIQEYATDQDQVEEVPESTETKIQEIEVLNVTVPDQTDEVKRPERRRQNKKKKRGKKSPVTKVDFPPHMIRAHQAAYAFLNPNISKFTSLLGLLDQAAHTQLSLRPMMSALVLRFDEINQALDEMAEEGELMLKEHGDHMGLASGMMGPGVILSHKSNGDKGSPPVDTPPDLLQQLLQHSTEKMRLVGGSFQAVGDNTLEEVAEYFASLSKVLVEKMEAKHNAEERIVQVLAQVEAATMRKCNREDSALHSEDSGIGGENDSLTGSDRQRRHRGSAGSGSSSGSSGANVRTLHNNSSNTSDPNECNEEEDEEEEDFDDEDDRPERKRSNSCPPDQTLLDMQEMIQIQRPHTAAVANKPEALLLLQNMKNNTDIRGNTELAGHQPRLLCKTNVCTLPALASQTPRPPSVKRLINSFGRPGQRTRKTGIPHTTEGALVHNISWPDSREDPEEEVLPPPPPEVLLDNSFQGTESISGNEKACQDTEGIPATNQRRGLSQRLRTVELLPNRGSIKPKTLNVSAVPPVRQDAIATLQEEEHQEAALHSDSSLYHQARKIIHIRSAAGSRGLAPQRSDSTDICEGDMSCSLPVIAPPVSRVRLPPSCPSVRHRIPSPPMGRPQSGSSRPSSPKSITRATDCQVEEIVPSVSFHDARSVFCRTDMHSSQPWSSSGTSVLPRPWGESRGRPGTRAMDPTRRSQSEQRATITIRKGVSQIRAHPGN